MPTFLLSLNLSSGSTRFQGKWKSRISNINLLDYIVKRVFSISSLDYIAFALPATDLGSELDTYLVENHPHIFKHFGSELDLIERNLSVGRSFNADFVIRYTCDDPFKDITALTYIINKLKCNPRDAILTEYIGSGYPQGTGWQVYKLDFLRSLHDRNLTAYQREHVVPAIKQCDDIKFVDFETVHGAKLFESQENVRFTIDFQQDLDSINTLVAAHKGHTSPENINYLDLLATLAPVSPSVATNHDLILSTKDIDSYNISSPLHSKKRRSRFSCEIKNAISNLLDTNFRGSQLISYTSKLEGLFAAKIGATYALACSNGTTTLVTALKALGVNQGDYVAVSALTMQAPALAVMSIGAIPVYIDSDSASLNMCSNSLENVISLGFDLKAIIFVSLYGSIVGFDKVYEVSLKHDIPIIEDNAETLFPSLGDKPYRIRGVFASYSFQASKHLTAGEGGILLTSYSDLYNLANLESRLGYQSSVDKTIQKCHIQQPGSIRHLKVGNNCRLSEFCALIAYYQLLDSDFLQEQRLCCASKYQEIQELYPHLFYFYNYSNLNCHSYWAYPLVFRKPEYVSRFFEYYHNNKDFYPYAAWNLAIEEPFTSYNLNRFQLEHIYGKFLPSYLSVYNKSQLKEARRLRPLVVGLRTNIFERERIIDEAMSFRSACEFVGRIG